MIKFLTRHPEKIYIPLLEHIQLILELLTQENVTEVH